MDFKDGILTEREYWEMKTSYEASAREAEQTASHLEQEKQKLIEKKQLDLSWVREFREKGKIEKITRRLVLAMIDRIEIFPKKQIKITFRFENEIQDIWDAIHPGQKEA